MSTITMEGLQEIVKLRVAVSELEQVQLLFNALAETTFSKTTDNDAATAFYLLQDVFNARLSGIAAMLPDPTQPLQVLIPDN